MNKAVKKEINKIKKEAKNSVEDVKKTKNFRPILIVALLISLIVGTVAFGQRSSYAISKPFCVAMLAANVALLVFAAEVRQVRFLLITSIIAVVFIIASLLIPFYRQTCDAQDSACKTIFYDLYGAKVKTDKK